MDHSHQRPMSCDTFVVLPPSTTGGCVIFGKNADRPCTEVQEVVYFPAEDHVPGSKVQCTYTEIDQVPHTHGVVLSKPAWMWGAEIGANEHGVCIGNEAVWTKLNGPKDLEEKLLGMDLLRLGLERGKSAREAMDVISTLLVKYGQGGNCSEGSSMTYHNGFLIADQSEAWILETAGPVWAAEKVSSGYRNISNQLTIRTKIDAMSPGLKEFAQEKGWWNPDQGEFDFAETFSDCFEETILADDEKPHGRQLCGTKLLRDFSKGGNFTVSDMFTILRDQDSGICMTGGFVSAGSQVSVLPPTGSKIPSCHWFTATPDPSISIFKPFIFCDNATLSQATISPKFGADDPVKTKPRFQKRVDRRHDLYKAHDKIASVAPVNTDLVNQVRALETHCVSDVEEILKNYDEKYAPKLSAMFNHMVNLEINFYK